MLKKKKKKGGTGELVADAEDLRRECKTRPDEDVVGVR